MTMRRSRGVSFSMATSCAGGLAGRAAGGRSSASLSDESGALMPLPYGLLTERPRRVESRDQARPSRRSDDDLRSGSGPAPKLQPAISGVTRKWRNKANLAQSRQRSIAGSLECDSSILQTDSIARLLDASNLNPFP